MWVVAVGRHNGPAFYHSLPDDYEVSETGQRRDHKPDCCGDAGWPSLGTTKAQKRTAAAAE